MKKILLRILLCSILFSGLIGCNNDELVEDNDELIGNNYECCKGCMCGDTIELLKSTETAWTLTEINNENEYVYNRHSFINFNGTGKNRFAFFKNDENGNFISKVIGEFSINKQNQIILKLDNNKIGEIICEIGEEKDLLAIIHCDNNFGTFTLQKEGTIELPNIIKDTMSKTKSIIVKENKQNSNETKKVLEEKEVNILLSIINSSKVWTGAITLPSFQYELELLDINQNSIAKIYYNPNHYFSIEIGDRSYSLTDIDKNTLNTILDK